MMIKVPERDTRYEAAMSAIERLVKAGFESYLVGGCVRDLLLQRNPRDYDIATAARPEDIRRVFPVMVETGVAFGVARICEMDTWIEVSTFRQDIGSADGRHPKRIAFAAAEDDARRRDFTINGMFFDPLRNKLLDFVEGQRDLQRRLVRAIGDPEKRFQEDYLRMLRAVRFAATLEFDVDIQTLEQIRRLSPNIGKISAERIQYELTLLLTEAPKAGRGLRLLRDSGLLKEILPEVDAMSNVSQPAVYHPEGDVLAHTAAMLDLMPPQRSPELAYAVLLHDVGKPAVRTMKEDATSGVRPFFPEHAERGAKIAENVLRRLRMPNRMIETVVSCVNNHMRFIHAQEMRPAKLRTWIAKPSFDTELELHRLDCLASHGDLSNYHFIQKFKEQVQSEKKLPAPWVTGHDLLRLGVPRGPDVGRFHKLAYEAQLDGKFRDRTSLLSWLESEIRKAGFTPNPR